MAENKQGKLMFITINQFFKDYLQSVNNDLGDNFSILIISKDIIADSEVRLSGYTQYKSRYEDIEFVPALFPNPNVMEYRYSSTIEQFADRYKNQLDQKSQMEMLCCIVDMVVNDNTDVFIVTANSEMSIGFLEAMKEFVFEKFGLIMTDYRELSENPNSINEIGNIDEIRMMLDFQIKNLKIIDENIGVFFNRLTKDMATEYRAILMEKSIDELYTIGTRQNLHINRHKPKEYIVDHILKKFIEDEELSFT